MRLDGAHRLALIAMVLIVATLAVFARAVCTDFVYDDQTFVQENPGVLTGVNGQNLWWALTTTFAAHWHPLTWLSWQLDCSLFGLNPCGFHLTNLLLHLANVVLLLLILDRLTGAVWRCALVAGLFALHPLHVESVAWIAERKDVLSTFFFLLTLWAYVDYVDRPSIHRYLLVAVMLSLGLMAKAMVATTPAVLLLLDYWPLGRWQTGGLGPGKREGRFTGHTIPWTQLVLEKLPLLAISALATAMTLTGQHLQAASKAMAEMALRLEVAMVAYATYLGKTFWPAHLAVYYPYPSELFPVWQVILAGLLLVAVTFLTFRLFRQSPYLLVGWLWFLGTLLPVIGLIRIVGGHGVADRYTYLPLIGLFIALSWLMADAVSASLLGVRTAGTLGAVMLVACGVYSWRQLGYWNDNVALWQHAIDVTPHSHLAHYNLGSALSRRGRDAAAVAQFARAVELSPDFAAAHDQLGWLLGQQGHIEEALQHYDRAIQLAPSNARLYYNRGTMFEGQGRFQEALRDFREVLRVDAGFEPAHTAIGRILAQQGEFAAAAKQLAEAIQLNSQDPQPHLIWGIMETRQQHWTEAREHLHRALAIDLHLVEGRYALGLTLMQTGDTPGAIQEFEAILGDNPNSAEAHNHLGLALLSQGEVSEAVHHLSEAVHLNPRDGMAHYQLALAEAQHGERERAIADLQEAVGLQPNVASFSFELAHLLQQTGQLQAAESAYARGLQIDPQWLDATVARVWQLAAAADSRTRNGTLAVRLAEEACEATHYQRAELLDCLAAAYAEVGRFSDATAMASKALQLTGNREQAGAIEARLHLYQQRKPFRAAHH